MGCGCLSKNVGEKVNERAITTVRRKQTDDLVIKEEKLTITPTPPRSDLPSTRQEETKSRNQNLHNVGSSFGKPERNPSSNPFVRESPQRLLNNSEDSKPDRSKVSRSASPKPKKPKQVLMELNVPLRKSKDEHIYYVSRSLQLQEPISGPQ